MNISFINAAKNFFRTFYLKKLRERLTNKDFSVIASNCNGALILHDLGMKFNSPFVNLWMKPKDFIKMLKNIQHYLSCELSFTQEEGIDYPVGLLDNIRIYFQHYKTEQDAKDKWEARTKRINWSNLFIMFSDRDGCTESDLKEFDQLPYKNKVVFVNKKYPDLESTFYIKGFEGEDSVGICSRYKSIGSLKKYYDDFDYVEWFNSGTTV